jgi:hypothetical protein
MFSQIFRLSLDIFMYFPVCPFGYSRLRDQGRSFSYRVCIPDIDVIIGAPITVSDGYCLNKMTRGKKGETTSDQGVFERDASVCSSSWFMDIGAGHDEY